MYACFRVKSHMSNEFSKYVVDLIKSVKYSLQRYVNGLSPQITSPALCRWRETFVNIQENAGLLTRDNGGTT